MLRIINGAVSKYPYTLADLHAEYPNTSFPPMPDAQTLAEFGVATLVRVLAPEYDTITHSIAEGTPTLANGVWTQQWAVTALDAATVAANQAKQIADIQASVVTATQNRLDNFARTRNYDGILSACTYATSAIPKFAAEGQYAVNARDNTWATLYTFMAEVQSGTRAMPSGFTDVEPLLPVLEWPL